MSFTRVLVVVLVATTAVLGGVGVGQETTHLDEDTQVLQNAVELSLLTDVQNFLENIDDLLETVVDLLETLQRLFGGGEGGD